MNSLPEPMLPAFVADTYETLSHAYGVVAAAGTGKTTAAARYGWFDSDRLELIRPELSTTNFPTWWAHLYALSKAVPAGSVITFLSGADAHGSGIATSNLRVVMPAWGIHRQRMVERRFSDATMLSIQTERAHIYTWAKKFAVPIYSDFQAIENRDRLSK
jgi:hypothetical protein